MARPVIVGEYHEHGYTITLMADDRADDEELYSAGNSPDDSQAYSAPEHGLPLKTIRQYCEQTGKELAVELHIRWGGASQVEDPFADVG
jgi:hypothetical protein